MQSDASSSSPKRSVSECPSHDSGIRSPPDEETSTFPLSDRDDDIDAYMAEQEQGSTSSLTTLPVQNGIVAAPSPGEKFSMIKELRSQKMQVGDTWYLVSRQWFKRWQKACTGELDKDGAIDENQVGPVDNSSLVDKDGILVSSPVEGVDVEFVSQEVWSYFTTWLVDQHHHSPLSASEFLVGTVNLFILFHGWLSPAESLKNLAWKSVHRCSRS